ncbi:unnamed protein product [Rhizophagus irregularis]|nr:unnamed protein product [Rhizophagus irregularis]
MFKLTKLKSLFNKLNISNKNSDNSNSDNSNSDNSNSDNSNSDNSNPDNSNPDNSNPDNSNPDNSNPDNSNPDNSISDNSISDNSISDNSNSDNSNSDNSNSANIDHKNCSYCNKSFTEELWCKDCDTFMMIEGWSSGNNEIDKFIKDTIYGARNKDRKLLEWVPFDKFKDINQIGEGGFSKVYSATWIDGPKIHKIYKSWVKRKSKPIKVALKRLNGSENMSAEYLNEIKILWDLCQIAERWLSFYGMTKDPETEELIIISEYADKGNLRSFISHNFNNTLWKDKLLYLQWIIYGLKKLHELGYFHKDFHSGNILQTTNPSKSDANASYISDFGLSGPSSKQKSDDKICGVLPYIAPEVLNGEPYSLSSDIYSFGIIMVELSSGKPPFHKRKHDTTLALEICNGLRPEFGKGTPEIYKKLAYKCMNANSNQRPTASELYYIIQFWVYATYYNNRQEEENFGYKSKEIRAMFKEANKEIPNISTSYEKNPDAIYTSRLFTFSNLTKPVNSSIFTGYLNDEENNKDCQDSQLVDLEVSNSFLQSKSNMSLAMKTIVD